MTEQEQLLNLYKEALESKKQALDESRLRLIEANKVIYEIAQLAKLYKPSMHQKEIDKIIVNYLTTGVKIELK